MAKKTNASKRGDFISPTESANISVPCLLSLEDLKSKHTGLEITNFDCIERNRKGSKNGEKFVEQFKSIPDSSKISTDSLISPNQRTTRSIKKADSISSVTRTTKAANSISPVVAPTRTSTSTSPTIRSVRAANSTSPNDLKTVTRPIQATRTMQIIEPIPTCPPEPNNRKPNGRTKVTASLSINNNGNVNNSINKSSNYTTTNASSNKKIKLTHESKPGTAGSRQALIPPGKKTRAGVKQPNQNFLKRKETSLSTDIIETNNRVDGTIISFLAEIGQRMQMDPLPTDPLQLCKKFTILIPNLDIRQEETPPHNQDDDNISTWVSQISGVCK